MLPKFSEYLKLDYSLEVMEKLISYQSNPDLGFRTSGSAAELAAADYLFEEMKKIGLKNVRKEAVTVDNFEFKRADLSYILTNGNARKVILSSFQARCQAENEEIEIVYAGKGREEDYEHLDVEGKYVLVDIDMISDWFIYWVVGQAASKSAKGIIVVQVDGFCSWSKDTLGVQDISTNANLPTFSMTVREADLLKATLRANGNLLRCVLNADVDVRNSGMTHCVIGEIPGEINEVIYLIGHYDAYFRAFADNASGIGCILGICKAFIESNYCPRRTLRVILHGAEEWGIEDTRYDWACGAYRLTLKHPEWGENGFMLVNLDGNVLCGTAEKSAVRTSFELGKSMYEIGEKIEGNIYPFEVKVPIWTWTESYMYSMLGIPTIESWYEPAVFWSAYHSSSDLREVDDYSDAAFLSSHILYGSFLQCFDELNARPICFTDLLDQLAESMNPEWTSKEAKKLTQSIRETREIAVQIEKKAALFTEMNTKTMAFNTIVNQVLAKVVNELFGLDWYENLHFIHTRNKNNIDSINLAIEHLREGKKDQAIDEDLRAVDLFWYAYNFDYKTYWYFVEQVLGKNAVQTWARGKVKSNLNLWKLSRALKEKRRHESSDFTEEIAQLNQAIIQQEQELLSELKKENDILAEIRLLMQKCLQL